MENPILELLKKNGVTIALVGVTNDHSKYGNIIYNDLKRKNIRVFGINPKASTIEGDKAYHSLDELGFKPDIINLVIPPKIALKTIQEAIEKGYDNFWLQPGAESDEIISLLKEKNKNFLAYACVMVQTHVR